MTGRSAVAAPQKRLGIDLLAIDGAVIEAQGFARPQWAVIRDWIKNSVSPKDYPLAWQEVATGWLTLIKQRSGSSYAGYQSNNLLLLTGRSREADIGMLRTGEAVIQQLQNWLGPLAEIRGHGKHVILDFATQETFYQYLTYFYPPNAPLKASGGVFLKSGYRHIALPPCWQVKNTLIHELTHIVSPISVYRFG